MCGTRRRNAVTTSCNAAAPAEVTRPMPRGCSGSGRFARRVEQAFGVELRLQAQELLEQRALPARCMLHDELQIARASYTRGARALPPIRHRAAKSPAWLRGGTWRSATARWRPFDRK